MASSAKKSSDEKRNEPEGWLDVRKKRKEQGSHHEMPYLTLDDLERIETEVKRDWSPELVPGPGPIVKPIGPGNFEMETSVGKVRITWSAHDGRRPELEPSRSLRTNPNEFRIIYHGMTTAQAKFNYSVTVRAMVPLTTPVGLDEGKLRESWEEAQNAWNNGPINTKDKAILEKVEENLKPHYHGIQRIVCLGMGNFVQKFDDRRNSYYQHLLAMQIRDSLDPRHIKDAGPYLYDPGYYVETENILKDAGFKIYHQIHDKKLPENSPRSANATLGLRPYFEMTDKTLLIECSSIIPTRKILAGYYANDETKMPKVIIRQGEAEGKESRIHTSPDQVFLPDTTETDEENSIPDESIPIPDKDNPILKFLKANYHDPIELVKPAGPEQVEMGFIGALSGCYMYIRKK